MPAWQLGQETTDGRATLSWFARRLSRRLLVCRRFGTATGSLLFLLEPRLQGGEWGEPGVHPGDGVRLAARRGVRDSG